MRDRTALKPLKLVAVLIFALAFPLSAHSQDGNAAKAADLWADVVQRGRHRFNHGEWDLAHFLYHLGEAQAASGNATAARAAFAESVQRFTVALGAQNQRTRNAKAALDKLNATATK